jgi:hypothetical protein
MRVTRKGILPNSRPQWNKRLDALRLYISELEMCLNTANNRIRELDGENELLRRNANCPYSRLVSLDEAEKEAGGDE